MQESYYELAHRQSEEIARQPTMLVGGELKEYQLKGLQWLVSLYNNDLNGILADEMGLGKTIQTISLLTYLYEFKNVKGPHLIVVPCALSLCLSLFSSSVFLATENSVFFVWRCPCSMLDTWRSELSHWAPDIKFIVYRGNKEERRRLREVEMKECKFNVMITQYELRYHTSP